jgi:hypothetical protein
MHRHPVATRTAALAGAVIAAAAALSGCGSSDGTAQQITPKTSSAGATTAGSTADSTQGSAAADSPTAPGTSGASGSTGSAAAGAVRTCSAGQLRLAVGPGDVGAGQLYTPIVFTNTGPASCALRGYPGVSVLDAQGKQIGSPATHEAGEPVDTVVLRPGKSASAALHTTNGPLGGACSPTGSALRVYPPASRESIEVKAQYQVCSGTFTVQPILP